MREISEPEEIAFESPCTEMMDKEEAAENRSNEFWSELEGNHTTKIKQYDNPDYSRNSLKKDILAFLRNSADHLASAMERCRELKHWGWIEDDMWTMIKFILAFKAEYTYFDEEEESEESDYLDDEEAFQYDVIAGCNKFFLEGASLAKRLGSPAYDTWIEAFMKLNDSYIGAETYKCVDFIPQAYLRTWADLCTWIYMKEAQKFTKKRKTVKKSKK